MMLVHEMADMEVATAGRPFFSPPSQSHEKATLYEGPGRTLTGASVLGALARAIERNGGEMMMTRCAVCAGAPVLPKQGNVGFSLVLILSDGTSSLKRGFAMLCFLVDMTMTELRLTTKLDSFGGLSRNG